MSAEAHQGVWAWLSTWLSNSHRHTGPDSHTPVVVAVTVLRRHSHGCSGRPPTQLRPLPIMRRIYFHNSPATEGQPVSPLQVQSQIAGNPLSVTLQYSRPAASGTLVAASLLETRQFVSSPASLIGLIGVEVGQATCFGSRRALTTQTCRAHP